MQSALNLSTILVFVFLLAGLAGCAQGEPARPVSSVAEGLMLRITLTHEGNAASIVRDLDFNGLIQFDDTLFGEGTGLRFIMKPDPESLTYYIVSPGLLAERSCGAYSRAPPEPECDSRYASLKFQYGLFPFGIGLPIAVPHAVATTIRWIGPGVDVSYERTDESDGSFHIRTLGDPHPDATFWRSPFGEFRYQHGSLVPYEGSLVGYSSVTASFVRTRFQIEVLAHPHKSPEAAFPEGFAPLPSTPMEPVAWSSPWPSNVWGTDAPVFDGNAQNYYEFLREHDDRAREFVDTAPNATLCGLAWLKRGQTASPAGVDVIRPKTSYELSMRFCSDSASWLGSVASQTNATVDGRPSYSVVGSQPGGEGVPEFRPAVEGVRPFQALGWFSAMTMANGHEVHRVTYGPGAYGRAETSMFARPGWVVQSPGTTSFTPYQLTIDPADGRLLSVNVPSEFVDPSFPHEYFQKR